MTRCLSRPCSSLFLRRCLAPSLSLPRRIDIHGDCHSLGKFIFFLSLMPRARASTKFFFLVLSLTLAHSLRPLFFPCLRSCLSVCSASPVLLFDRLQTNSWKTRAKPAGGCTPVTDLVDRGARHDGFDHHARGLVARDAEAQAAPVVA